MRYCHVIILVLLLCVSCHDNIVTKEYKTIDNQWDRSDIITFDISVEKQLPFELYVNIRNTEAYEKANLWLFIDITSPEGYTQRDTLDCLLADKYGRWLGNGFGGVYDSQHLLEGDIRFSKTGKWTVAVQQAMRKEKIPGIKDVGIMLKQKEP